MKILARDKTAVSFIETVVVLAMMLILAVAATIRIGTYHTLRVHMAARRIVADLRYAQHVAMSGRNNAAVTFSSANNSYEIRRCIAYQYGYFWGPHILDPLTQEDLIVQLDQEIYGGITIEQVSFSSGGSSSEEVFFTSEGIPCRNIAGPSIDVDGFVRIVYRNHSLNVCVTPETGEVSIRQPGESFDPQ